MLIKQIDYWDIFDAYDWQRDLIRAFFSGDYDNYLLCLHRRAGKDFCYWNLAWLVASMVPGNYLYTLPKIAQSKNVIWQGTMLDGRRWIDLIPKYLLSKPPNNTERKLYFTSGSILTITGADSILGSHLGSNLHGIFISELQRTSPGILDYLRPILKRTSGFLCANFTAFGKNHAYHLLKTNEENPRWYCKTLTVDDTKDNNGMPIFSKAQIDEERLSGMTEDLISQEYYCDFNIAVKGTYFSEEIQKLRDAGQILPSLEIYPSKPVHTSWDLGSRDTNSIWFFQVVGTGEAQQFRYFYQHDSNYKDIPYYISLMKKIKEEYGFSNYGHSFLPHDVSHTEWSSAKTRRVLLLENGLKITPVPMLKVIERVQVARNNLKQCWFATDGCKNGIMALEASRAKYDEKLKAFSSDELHDWASHPSAAFQYGHVGWLDSYNKTKLAQQRQYAKYRPI